MKVTIEEMTRVIAIALQAKSFTLIDNKKYKFYLTNERSISINKDDMNDINYIVKLIEHERSEV